VITSKLKQTLTSTTTPVLGTWMTIGDPDIAEIMVRAGFDFVVVDLEHSYIGTAAMGELIRVIELAGAAPIVRLSSNDPVQAKRAMDSGAHGVIVPMVNSADEARAAYRALQYPPDGTRGVGLGRAQGYGPDFHEYRRRLKESAVLVVQIEHEHGVANLESILALDEVDAFILGPYDLSASLGVPGDFQHAKYRDAIAQVERVAKKSGKAAGVHIVEPSLDELNGALDRNYRFIAYSVDIRILESQLSLAVKTARARA
jgi:2-dehydro-3-deoxyglucarate aldolase